MNTSLDLDRRQLEAQLAPPPVVFGSSNDTSSLPPPRICICLSNESQDPRSISLSWKTFVRAGCIVEFATENGAISQSDPRFLQKSWLRDALGTTNKQTVELFYELVGTDAYLKPHAWSSKNFDVEQYDAIVLGHGTDKKLRQYLESPTLHRLMAAYFQLTKRVTSTPIKRSSTFRKRYSVPAPAHVPDQMEQVVEEKQKITLENLETPRKVVGAIGRGVLVLAKSKFTDNLSDDEFDPRRSSSAPPALEDDNRPATPGDLSRTVSTTKAIAAKKTTFVKLAAKLTRSTSMLDSAKPKRTSTNSSLATEPTAKELKRVSRDLERLEKEHDEMLGRSVLYHVETTSTPSWMESTARTVSTVYGFKGMFNTYARHTQLDVQDALASPSQFHMGPKTMVPFALVDPSHHYVSARYPGDTLLFAHKILLELVSARKEWAKHVPSRDAIPESDNEDDFVVRKGMKSVLLENSS